MPTFTPTALQTLLPPRTDSSNLNQLTAKLIHANVDSKEMENEKQQCNYTYISPALYIKPEPRPVMDSDENENEDMMDYGYDSSSAMSKGDFFDAYEDFSSDGSISNVLSCGQSMESELRATRLSLLEEIDRRKTSEDALCLMYSKWQRLSGFILSQTGLTVPTPSNACCSMQLEINSIDQFAQEVIVVRFVAEAIGKGQARAEAELAAETIIESKDQEISRVRDKLQYYETVNREMSQRNQEVVEVARRQRQRKNGQQKWLWSCIGLSIAIGASVIAYSYLPQTSGHYPLLTPSDPSDSA